MTNCAIREKKTPFAAKKKNRVAIFVTIVTQLANNSGFIYLYNNRNIKVSSSETWKLHGHLETLDIV